MATPQFISPADSFINFLIEKISPEEILAYQASESEQARADELTEKNKSGTLTSAEQAELTQMLELDLLVSLLKARALVALNKP